jgi:hypothetical protein
MAPSTNTSLFRLLTPLFQSFRNASISRSSLPSTTPLRSPLSNHFSTSPQLLARGRKGKQNTKDPRVSLIRYHLRHAQNPRPLRFSRMRALRHWTIHRAWMLNRRKRLETEDLELQRYVALLLVAISPVPCLFYFLATFIFYDLVPIHTSTNFLCRTECTNRCMQHARNSARWIPRIRKMLGGYTGLQWRRKACFNTAEYQLSTRGSRPIHQGANLGITLGLDDLPMCILWDCNRLVGCENEGGKAVRITRNCSIVRIYRTTEAVETLYKSCQDVYRQHVQLCSCTMYYMYKSSVLSLSLDHGYPAESFLSRWKCSCAVS